ncbi:BamA/TamA family outer membrane protein [Candidatus Neomarinimicrobiota bacterium]
MTKPIKTIFVQFTIYLLLASCSGIKHLPKAEKLYTGAEINLESTDHISHRKKKLIKTVAENAVRPKPNKKIVGLRPKLWMYMKAGENPQSKLKKWFKKNGEAPVFISSIKPAVTSAIINARFFNIGIFNSYTEFKIIEKQKTSNIIYTSHISVPYTLKEIIYSISDSSLRRIILTEKKKSLIKACDDYNLEKLKIERIQIDALLKDNGYFYFNPDFLLFKADTSVKNHDVTLRLTLKDSIPEKALTVYRINKVFIDQDFSLDENVAKPKDTLWYQGNYFLGKEAEMRIRPKVISRSVYLRKNEIYSRKNHNITLNRLMTMGNFKFVSMNFSDSDTTAAGFLDVTILMTPMSKHTFRAEIEIVSKSNNYTGPNLNTSFMNRNTFKGAELLNLNLAASFEAQLSGTTKNLFSFSVNPQVELYVPRFILPFKIKTNGLYIPKTRLSLSYISSKRVGYFGMRALQFTYGYKWKQDIRIEHEFNPVNIRFTKLLNQTTTFSELLVTNPFLKKSYEEQFIVGGTYIYTYNEQVFPLKKIQYFFQLTTEAAGNAFSLVKTITGGKISAENPSSVIGSAYSQYALLSIDGRGYYNFRDNNKLAMRVYAGIGKPYGNSSVLPYPRQFFSGGPNSIRAFSINSVGPGTYNQKNDSIGFLQLGGDLKLELNSEYRFGIYRFLKGAVFADAGNVWLLKSNPSTLGDPFSFSRFVNEIAVGAGVGLRIDVSFFILRFDLATPLHKPWLEQNNKWVINEINPWSSTWRKENLILNVAIGYPF